jgi:pyruvate dehydrogenase E1 component
MYARAFLEGRLSHRATSTTSAANCAGRRPVVLSAPVADARLLAVPDGVDGPGPDHGDLPGALQPLPREPRPEADNGDRKVWAFLGDGECDEPEALGAITLASREKLDNLIFVVNCNLQRLDGPVRGNGKIIQELEASSAARAGTSSR